MCAQFHIDPETYLDEIRAEVPRYDELQEATVGAIPFPPRRVLELGVGTGETTRRLLERYPDAEVTGLDSQPEMVFKAREVGIAARLARMEDRFRTDPGTWCSRCWRSTTSPTRRSATCSGGCARRRGGW